MDMEEARLIARALDEAYDEERRNRRPCIGFLVLISACIIIFVVAFTLCKYFG